MTGVEHGLPAIAAMFAAARAAQRSAFLPYYPIGYPSYAESLDAISALAELGADGFESVETGSYRPEAIIPAGGESRLAPLNATSNT